MRPSSNESFECPVCKATVPPGAKACPGCGSDENTGWNEEATRYDGLDLPEEPAPVSRDTAPQKSPGGYLPLIVVLVVLAIGLYALAR